MEDLQGRIDLEQALLVYGNQLSHIYSTPLDFEQKYFFSVSFERIQY